MLYIIGLFFALFSDLSTLNLNVLLNKPKVSHRSNNTFSISTVSVISTHSLTYSPFSACTQFKYPAMKGKEKMKLTKVKYVLLYQRDPLKRSCNLYNSWIGEVQEQLISSNIKWAAPVAVMNKDKLKWQTGVAKKVTGGWTSLIQKELQNSEQWTVNLWYYNQQIYKIHFQTHNFENGWTKKSFKCVTCNTTNMVRHSWERSLGDSL